MNLLQARKEKRIIKKFKIILVIFLNINIIRCIKTPFVLLWLRGRATDS